MRRDKGATVTAEQSYTPSGRGNLPPQLYKLTTSSKVQRRIKFFRFVRRLLKSVRLRSSFQRKDNACLSLPAKYFKPGIPPGCTSISGYTTDIAMPPSNCPAKIIPPRCILQIISGNVRECPFWFRSFPRNVEVLLKEQFCLQVNLSSLRL